MSTATVLYLPYQTDSFSCICKAEFCYVCGKIWGNCNCPTFAFRRRTEFRAERAVERYTKHLLQTWGRPDPRSFEDQVQEVRNALENGCDHNYWHRVQMTRDEPGHCKLCKYVGHKHIYKCIFCPLTSCWTCHTDAPPECRREQREDAQQQQA